MHPLSGVTIAFATMHEKEKILIELFRSAIGAEIAVPNSIDTDRYGTFSGEVSRLKDIKTVLRQKAKEGAHLLGTSFGLASEGSFGAHPWVPFLECNQESLLFVDFKSDIEILSHTVSTENRAEYKNVTSEQELLQFCRKVGLGAQAVILKPSHGDSDPEWIFKGLTSVSQVIEGFRKLRRHFSTDQLWVETDNRAHLNPKRREVIRRAGEQLIQALCSLCPDCGTPGFQMSDFIRGLKCSDCGFKSNKPLKEIWSCPYKKCDYSETRPRLDGVKTMNPAECKHCNP